MDRPEAAGLSSERLARIRPVMEKWIGDDRIAGAITLLSRRGRLVHLDCVGMMDRERGIPMRPDTIFRIWSMTKPITCVALMTLYERGNFQLSDPVSAFIPAFRDLRVYAGGTGEGTRWADPEREVTIRDLLTHTSGLTYHFLEDGPVEEMYREAGVSSRKPLAEFVDDLLEMPLAFQPGSAWRYSYAHDVAARLIEIMSGQALDAYLAGEVFEPLGMVDTGYHVPPRKLARFSAQYGSADLLQPQMTLTQWYGRAEAGANGLLSDPTTCLESTPHGVFRGGHGLVSTASDYLRFCQMLLGEGELDGIRLLSRKTVEVITTNHLSPNLLPYEVGGTYSPGYGYGLGFRVLMDLGQCQTLGSVGEFGWVGAATTYFWVDPLEGFIGILMSQFQPEGFHPITLDFRVMAYQAIMD